MISWTKGKEVNDFGTLALVFTITNNDRLSRALSNSGSGILYGLDYSVIGEDGTAYAATEPSGALAGNEMHAPIDYQASKDGGVKFKVPKGNYRAVLERKLSGKVAQSFACTLIAQ
jgi:outer membrane lipoprotein SlyB